MEQEEAMVARGLELQRRKEGKAVKISSSSNYIASQPSDHFTILLDFGHICARALCNISFMGAGRFVYISYQQQSGSQVNDDKIQRSS